MDLNESVVQFQQQRSPSSPPLAHIHNFMHVPSPLIHHSSSSSSNSNSNGNGIGIGNGNNQHHYHHQQTTAHHDEMEENMQSNVMQLQRQNLQLFWHQQILEIAQLSDFKQHQLPLARIKRIMKSDEDVKMISADAPVLFSKACELFILEVTLRSWLNTEENRRRTLQRTDIANAVSRGEVLDFLVDIVPLDQNKDEDGEKNIRGGSQQQQQQQQHNHSSNGNGMSFVMINPDQFHDPHNDHQNHHDLNGEFMSRDEQEITEQFVHHASPASISY